MLTNHRRRNCTTTLCITLAISTLTLFAADSASLSALQGTWEGKRTTEDGTDYKQVIEIKGETLKYSLFKSDGELRLFAKGKTKVEKLGAIKVLRLSDIEAGATETELQTVDDDRSTPFILTEDTLTLASNLDKVRADQKPRIDVYQLKSRPAVETSSNGKLIGTWKLSVKFGDTERDYELQLSETDGALKGLVKKQGGEDRPLKTATFKDGKFTMEIVREIQGTEVLVIYHGELKEDALSGTFAVQGQEEKLKGTWAAKR